MPKKERPINFARGSDSIRSERDCTGAEFFVRRLYSGLFYWRFYRKRYPDRPYYTPGAIDQLTRLVDSSSTVFEWGSGVSTVWWAKKVRSITAIEHDEVWFNKVEDWLREKELSTADLRLVCKQDGALKAYCHAIDDCPDSSFDLIAVDGRERVACVRRAIPKLRSGGWLLLDDSHRPKYREVFDELHFFRILTFDYGLLQTSLFRKP